MKTGLLKSAVIAVLIAISTNMHAYTAVVSGAWSSATTWGGIGPGSTVSNQDIIIPTGITVDLDVDVTFNGLLINTFTVDGTLNSSTNNSVWLSGGNLAGAGTIDIQRFTFNSLLTTSSYSGMLTLNTLRNQAGPITLAGSTSVSDSLDLVSGSVILATGGNLTMGTNSNIRVDAGTLATTGGAFSATGTYHVWYVGTTKTTGLEINSSNLGNFHMNLNDNTQILTLGISNLVINGTLDMQMGQFDISNNDITLNGDIVVVTGSLIISNATSDIAVRGSGATTDGLRFAASSTLNTLEIDRSTNGSVKLGNTVAIVSTVFLTNGDLILMSGAVLTMNAGSRVQVQDGNFVQNGGVFNGAASYDVDYIGSTHTSGVELTGSGLNDVMVGLSSASDTIILNDNITINGNLDMYLGMMSLDGNDLTLDGTFDQNASAYFVGDSTSRMTLNLTSTNDTIWFGGSMHLDVLVVNIPTATSILLASDLTIHNSLDLTSGKLEITNSSLHMRPSASINGWDDTRYIVTSGTGQVEMQVVSNSTYITYPIGTMTEYAPAYIQQTASGTTGMFSVRTMDNVYSQGTTGFDASSTESVVDKSWVVDAAAAVTVVNMNVRFGWKVADEVNGFNRNQSHITKYNNNAWDSYMTSAATPGSNGTYESSRTGTTSDGIFAVVDTSVTLGLNDQVTITGVSIYPNPTVDVVTVETGDAHTNYLYEIYDFTGKIIDSASNANAVNRFDFSAYSNGFYFIRITNIESNATVTKRISKN